MQRLSEALHLPTQFRLWGKSARGPEKGVRFTPLITNIYPPSPAPAPRWNRAVKTIPSLALKHLVVL